MDGISKGEPVLQSLLHALSETATTLLIGMNVWKCVMLGNFLDDLILLEFAWSFELFFVCFASIVCFPLYSNLLYCFWEEKFPRTAVILDHGFCPRSCEDALDDVKYIKETYVGFNSRTKRTAIKTCYDLTEQIYSLKNKQLREEATFSIKVWGNNQGWCWGCWFGKHKTS